MELEALVKRPTIMSGGWCLSNGVLDLLPLLEQLIDCDPVLGANLFHGTLIAGIAEWVAEAASAEGLRTAAFISGYRGSPLGGFDKALWWKEGGFTIAGAAPWVTHDYSFNPERAAGWPSMRFASTRKT